jgi:cytochrome b subunit of formate dehydrogenase
MELSKTVNRLRPLGTRFLGQLFCLAVLVCLLPRTSAAQSNDDCMSCHEDKGLTGERKGRTFSAFVDPATYKRSIHKDVDCISCHTFLDGVEDFPHSEVKPKPPDCSACHDDVTALYVQSLHGQAVAKGEVLAPRCWDCHGTHDILPHTDDSSRVTKFNIPLMCGRCHKEGSPVGRAYEIPQDSILEHYSISMHGEGLYKRGLTVTAVCTDCHTAHFVLPHTDPRSSISREKVAQTCQQCHGRIEQVHQKVIRGELWEKEPAKVPVCVDCHQPHQVRRVYYDQISDDECMKCHANRNLSMVRDGATVSLFVDTLETHASIHRAQACAQCHTNANPSLKRPCATVGPKVDCGVCHTEVVEMFATSTHGLLADRGDPNGPICTDCHGKHMVRGRRDPKSPTFPTNVPAMCEYCHQTGGKAAVRREARGLIADAGKYPESIHGKGLLESGLVVTAMCTDCHTAHHVLPKDNPESSVNHLNVPHTCAKCHSGIYEKYVKSIHADTLGVSEKKMPNCADCHRSHTISRTDSEGFKQQILGQCGNCHLDVTETYFETFHGKVFQLGGTVAAKCHDCHGSHDILKPDDPNSHLSRNNIVATCGKCHEGSHRRFAGYLTHATHHDRIKYPILFYVFWFMTILLVGTLAIATVHTLLWLPRSFQMMRQHKALLTEGHDLRIYRRFTRQQSVLHILMVTSFIGLAITGMTLKFSYLSWAQWLSGLLGGFESAGFIHRVCATITAIYFGSHIYSLIQTKRRQKMRWRDLLIGPNTMMPTWTDAKEVWGTFKWFIGVGPRPSYGRWTYWEKFDYFAVFWGVAIIGSTGLMLWFPEFFTHFLPGWMINVATIIHSDEALLATAFIFTVHFFNTHFRPDRFPMDTVIFTGRMTVEELKTDRPREYQDLVDSGKLEENLTEPLPPTVVKALKIFGAVALIIGLSLILLVIYAEVFGYR